MKTPLIFLSIMSTTCIAQEPYEQTCNHDAFKDAVAKDERYIEPIPISSDDIDMYLEKYQSLDGEFRRCAEQIPTQHIDAFLDHCSEHGCYTNIGGGCAHIVGQQFWMYKYAYEQCKP